MTPVVTGPAAESPPRQRSSVFSLIGVVLLTLIAFSAFFIGFLLAPLAILLFFSLIFYARNRSGGRDGGEPAEVESSGGARGRLIAEARARQAALTLEERQTRAYEDLPPEEAGRPADADAVASDRSSNGTD
jgi:hypothetical protein